jgi:hypothetical protein
MRRQEQGTGRLSDGGLKSRSIFRYSSDCVRVGGVTKSGHNATLLPTVQPNLWSGKMQEELTKHVQAYVRGEIARDDLYAWLLEQDWSKDDRENPQQSQLAEHVLGILQDTDGRETDDSIREKLARALQDTRDQAVADTLAFGSGPTLMTSTSN